MLEPLIQIPYVRFIGGNFLASSFTACYNILFEKRVTNQ